MGGYLLKDTRVADDQGMVAEKGKREQKIMDKLNDVSQE